MPFTPPVPTDNFNVLFTEVNELIDYTNIVFGGFRSSYSGTDVTTEAGKVKTLSGYTDIIETVHDMTTYLAVATNSKIVVIGIDDNGDFVYTAGADAVTGTEVLPDMTSVDVESLVCYVTVDDVEVTDVTDLRFKNKIFTPSTTGITLPYATSSETLYGEKEDLLWEDDLTTTSSHDKMCWASTGIYFYTHDRGDNFINQWYCPTPWSLDGAYYLKWGDIDTTNDNFQGMFISTDGTKIYQAGYLGNLYYYTLATPYQIDSFVDSPSGGSVTHEADDIMFNNDGTKFYYLYKSDSKIYQRTASSPWITTGGSLDIIFPIAEAQYVDGFVFNSSGKKLYVVSDDELFEWTLTVAYDLSSGTVTYNDKVTLPNISGGLGGLAMSSDDSKLFVFESGGVMNEFKFGLSGGSESHEIDASLPNNYFDITFPTDTPLGEITIINIPTDGTVYRAYLNITCLDGGCSISWPGNFVFEGGSSPPAFTKGMIEIFSDDDGVTVYATVSTDV